MWLSRKAHVRFILRTFSLVCSKEAIDTNFVSSRERREGWLVVCAGCSLLTPLLVIWLESHCYPFMSNSSMQWGEFVIPLCLTTLFKLFVILKAEYSSVVWRMITSCRQTGNTLLNFKFPLASPGTPFGVWMLKYWGRDKYLNGILSKSGFMCPANTHTICSDYSEERGGFRKCSDPSCVTCHFSQDHW